MNIDWIENITKKEAYNRTLEFAVAYGMTEDNSSTVTLLFQPGSSLLQEEVQTKALQFLDGIESPAVISIEPVLPKLNESLPKLYRYAGFKNFQLLPLYHIHILLIEEKYEVRSQRKKWEGLIKCKQRNLFQCKYIETNIRTTSNYITKFFEEKNDNVGVIGFYVPAKKESSEQTQLKIEIDSIVNNYDLPCETISVEVLLPMGSQLTETVLSENYSPNYLIIVMSCFSEFRFELICNVVPDISRFIRPP